MVATIGLVVVSIVCAAGVTVAIIQMRRTAEAFIAHLDRTPHVLGKTEDLAKAELDMRQKELEIREKDAEVDRQIRLEQSWRKQMAQKDRSRGGVTAAEMIESDLLS